MILYESISKASPIWFKNVVGNLTYLLVVLTMIYIYFDICSKNNLAKKKDKIDSGIKNSELSIPKKSTLNKYNI